MARQRMHVASGLPSPQRNGSHPMWYGGPDPITLNKMKELVSNVRSLSIPWYERNHRPDPNQDPRRDLDDECGYPKGQWAAEDYRDLINREPLACLMNEFEALESWAVFPDVYEDEDEETETDFEFAWRDLPNQMGPEPNYFDEQKGSSLFALMLLADIHCGEGRHGAVVFGLDDGKAMGEPTTYKSGQKVKWVRSFPEYMCRITSFDMDPQSSRYMRPMTYDVTFADPRDTSGSGITESYTTETVHWSRVVHVGDSWHSAPNSVNMMVPRLRPIRDPLLDYRKVRASSAEMYYKAAFVGLHFGTHPQLGADVFVDTDSLKDMYEEYVNGLQRAIFTNGMTVDPMAPGVVDPNPQLLAQVTSIAMKKRIPMRILMGSERGELASGDDKVKWNNWMRTRQHNHNTPNILGPVANRLVNLGVLPKPAGENKSGSKSGGLKCWWPDLASRTEEERVKILLTRTQAYKEYVANDIGSIVPPLDYMTKFDNMSKEEAEVIIESAEEAELEAQEEAQALADEMGLVPDLTEEGFKEPTPEPDPEGDHERAIELEEAKAKARAKVKPATNEAAEYLDFLVENAKAKLTGGEWKTIHGSPVYVKGGKVVAGPGHLEGKSGGEGSAPSSKLVSIDYGSDPKAKEHMTKLLGTEDHASKAALLGAREGATVTIKNASLDAFTAYVKHPDYVMITRVKKDALEIDDIRVVKTGTGLGTEIVHAQVEAAAKAGMKSVGLEAIRDGANGYYTWARLGWDAPLKSAIPNSRVAEALQYSEGKTVDTVRVSDLMKTPAGREWWKKHGDTFGAEMDLTEGSTGRKVLDTYAAESKSRKKPTTNTTPPEVEEAILDRVWDSLRKNEGE